MEYAHDYEKKVRLYLLQTGQIEDNIKSEEIRLGGRSNDKFVDFNYMGSAEYEFGASRSSFKYIMEHYSEYDLFESYIKNLNDVPFHIFCRRDMLTAIQNAIADHSRKGYRGDIIEMKEPCYLWAHLTDVDSKFERERLKWARMNNNFWWDFQNHWMGFFGAADRINAFKRAISNDRIAYLKYTEG